MTRRWPVAAFTVAAGLAALAPNGRAGAPPEAGALPARGTPSVAIGCTNSVYGVLASDWHSVARGAIGAGPVSWPYLRVAASRTLRAVHGLAPSLKALLTSGRHDGAGGDPAQRARTPVARLHRHPGAQSAPGPLPGRRRREQRHRHGVRTRGRVSQPEPVRRRLHRRRSPMRGDRPLHEPDRSARAALHPVRGGAVLLPRHRRNPTAGGGRAAVRTRERGQARAPEITAGP